MSRKQRKIEKEIRARKAAEEKIAREEAEKERLANRTPKEKAEDNKNTALGCGVIILILLLIGGCNAVFSDDDKDKPAAQETSTSVSASDSSEEKDAKEESAKADGAAAEEWLKEQMGVHDWSEILAMDSSMWGGYINGSEVSHGVWHVRLQIDRDLEKDKAENAANAISTFLRFDNSDPRVRHIDWVVVEDGAGVVIAQESV